MKTFSCNAIFFPFADHHNAAKNKQTNKQKTKPQDKEKKIELFLEQNFKKFKLQFFWGILKTLPPNIPEKQKDKHLLILYRFMYTEAFCNV